MKKPFNLCTRIFFCCCIYLFINSANSFALPKTPDKTFPPSNLQQPVFTYCTPAVTGAPVCGFAWIGQVIFDSAINKLSGCSGGYTDYTASDTIKKRAGEPIAFTIKEGGLDKEEYVNIYIDYNNDGDFEDEGEKVADQIYMNAAGTHATGSFTIPVLQAPGNYRIRVISDQTGSSTNNPCETAFGEAEDYILEITQPLYCTPEIEEPCNMWITNVSIGDINNSSTQPAGCDAGGYTDYSASFYTVAGPGSTVNFSMSAVGNQYQFSNIYIDYNNDGDFDDINELAAADIILDTAETISYGTFTIPALQPEGIYRIRVKSYAINTTPTPGPCSNSVNGETEDYRIIIACIDNGSDVYVTGNQQEIRAGSAAPDILNNTDYGFVLTNTNKSHTFKIYNPGTNVLTISGITVTGADAAFFTVTSNPASTLNAGDSTSFTLRFSPVAAHIYEAVIHINTNNCRNSDYDIAFKGNGVTTLQSYARVTMNIQGYYDASVFEMKPVAFNLGITNINTAVDSVTIELHHASSFALVTSATGVLHTDGILNVSFPPTSGNFYLVIKHKNSIETWSATPVSFTAGEISPYNFTQSAAQAFGNNQVEVEYGVWAIYTGDLNADGNIDINDYVLWESDYNNLASGNISTDLNGDGNVDIADYPIWETNYNNLVSVIMP